MKKTSTQKITLVGLCVALNIIGAFIALMTRIPLLFDSIGTIMVSALLGPVYGIATGLTSSIISGVTYDVYALYFAPVQIAVGLLAAILYKKGLMKGKKSFIGVFLLSTVSAFMGAVIAAYVFGGVTSSGSSYIVQVLSSIGVNKVVSVFITQFLMDYADRFISVMIVNSVIVQIPQYFKQKLVGQG